MKKNFNEEEPLLSEDESSIYLLDENYEDEKPTCFSKIKCNFKHI
jgi:hypothetical protein